MSTALLQGKFAVITGAASNRGLGKATAKLLRNTAQRSLFLIWTRLLHKLPPLILVLSMLAWRAT